MSVRFRNSFRNTIVGWLLGGDGERLWFVIRYILDGFMERVRQSVLMRYPQYAVDPAALQYIGADRVMPRGIRESDESYARRLKNFRGIRGHRTRGNGTTLAFQIADYLPLTDGSQSAATVSIYSTHAKTISVTYDVLGTENVSAGYSDPTPYPDGLTGKARFYIDLTGYPWSYNVKKIGAPDLWDEGKVGGDNLIGFVGISASEADGLRALVKQWKPAATLCDWISIDGGRLGVS